MASKTTELPAIAIVKNEMFFAIDFRDKPEYIDSKPTGRPIAKILEVTTMEGGFQHYRVELPLTCSFSKTSEELADAYSSGNALKVRFSNLNAYLKEYGYGENKKMAFVFTADDATIVPITSK